MRRIGRRPGQARDRKQADRERAPGDVSHRLRRGVHHMAGDAARWREYAAENVMIIKEVGSTRGI
jgi:hypothetical protein